MIGHHLVLYPLLLYIIISTCGFYRYGPQFQTSIPSYMELPSMLIGRIIGTNNKQYRGCGYRKWAWPHLFHWRAQFHFQTSPPNLKSWMKLRLLHYLEMSLPLAE